ncbi:hypothetical protein ACFOWE_21525 [Planomonospora corallina]|uniref:DUF4160 domain-containing protein n=1 Tax=Planomonospora corallina TaxID=1806052 RepID=A0ABV8I9I4_9ACTN
MDGNDPHIHVEVDVIHADAALRNMMASAFGLVGELPSAVATGCGLRVPYAMTSPRPESVTCLACREHAHRRHLDYADQVERLSAMPGTPLDPHQAAQAAQRHRELAEQFTTGDG